MYFESYDAEIYDCAHVSVQPVGRRFHEDKMPVLAECLGDQLGKSGHN